MTSFGANDAIARRLQELETAATTGGCEGLIEEALGDACLEVRARASTVAARHLAPERLALVVSRGDHLGKRASAMAALVRAGERALPVLLANARGPVPTVALFFVQVLGHVRAPEALLALRELATHADPLLAQAAMEGLGHQRDRESVPLLLRALESSPWVAVAAVRALAEIGDARALAPLEKLRDDELLGEAAQAALRRLRARPCSEPFDA